MQKILILFAHPAFQKSRVNKILVPAVRDLDGVTFHDLYEAYPDLSIDVAWEQDLVAEHDVIVFHHPFFWYSTPAILKEWQDLVLQHGWAYGSEGTALHGKMLLSVITTGGRESAYQEGGYNRFTMGQFLVPFEQTARLCGMRYLPPVVIHGTLRMPAEEMERHASDYRAILEGLRDGHLDLDRAAGTHRLNTDMDAILKTERRP